MQTTPVPNSSAHSIPGATVLGLVRHGETDWNAERRIQGQTDIPLNDRGREQARRTAERLSEETWAAIYSSPLIRARETAEIIASALGLNDPLLLPEVQERRFGEIEGLTPLERVQRFPDETIAADLETREEVVARAQTALTQLALGNPQSRLLIVTHGGVVGSLLRHLTDHRLPGPHEVIGNGSLNAFSVGPTGSWQVELYSGLPGAPDYRPVP